MEKKTHLIYYAIADNFDLTVAPGRRRQPEERTDMEVCTKSPGYAKIFGVKRVGTF